jgi:Protease inhibitor Inh
MPDFDRISVRGKHGARAAAALLVLAALTACASAPTPAPPPVAAAPPPSPPLASTPPPIDLAGRWRLTAAAGGACFMTLGDAPGATQGTIAPEGGCPGNFFTSRKWTFEHDALIVRDHKGQPLAQLSFTGGHFEGQDDKGGTLSLSH